MVNFLGKIFGGNTSDRTGTAAAPARPRDVSIWDRLGLNNSAYNAIAIRQAMAENERKTQAYNVLRNAYGDIAGDPDAATKLQDYQQSQERFPIEQQQRQLNVDRTGQIIRQSDQAFPVELEGQRLGNEQTRVNIARTGGLAQGEETARRRSAQLNAAQILAQVEARGGDVSAAFDRLAQEAPDLFDDVGHAEQIRGAIASGDLTAADLVTALSGQGGGDAPASVQEYKFRLGLTPEQDAAFLEGKRAGATPSAAQALASAKALGRGEGTRAAEDLPLSESGLVTAMEALDMAEQEYGAIERQLDLAINDVGTLSAGLGSATKFIPGTPAAGLAARMKSITGNLINRYVQQLKNLSSTGSTGFGQLTELEAERMASSFAALDQAQSPTQLREELKTLKKEMARSRERVRKAYVADLAARGQAPSKAISEDGWSIEEVQ